MTPEKLEIFLNDKEYRLGLFLKENKILSIPVLSGIFYLFFLKRKILFLTSYSMLNFKLIAYSANLIFLLIFSSFFFHVIKSKKKIYLQIALFFFAGFVDLNISNFGNGNAFSYLAFPILVVLGSLFYLKNLRWYIFFIISILYFFLVFYFADLKDWFFFKKPILFVCFVCTHIYANSTYNFKNKLKLLFNPAHLFFPVNYPILNEIHFESPKNDLWSEGMVQILKALVLIYFSEYLNQYFDSFYYLNLYGLSILMYIRYLLLAPGVANIITGISKVFEINVVDCSNHLWLSSSPFEFLKRENVHAYEFSIRFFYFNFLKFTRNIYVILLFYFLLFPLYRDFNIFFYGSGFKNPEGVLAFFKLSYIFWMFLFALIISSFIFPIFKSAQKKWISVIFNHAVYILMFTTMNLFFMKFVK